MAEKQNPVDPSRTSDAGSDRTAAEVTVSEKTSKGNDKAKDGGPLGRAASRKMGGMRSDGKVVLLEKDVYDQLAFSYPRQKKWYILSVIFAIQCSMNLNAGAHSYC